MEFEAVELTSFCAYNPCHKIYQFYPDFLKFKGMCMKASWNVSAWFGINRSNKFTTTYINFLTLSTNTSELSYSQLIFTGSIRKNAFRDVRLQLSLFNSILIYVDALN